MRVKKSIIVPIAAILTGVLLQLDTLGLTGDLIPGDILAKLWPLLLVAAGLDLLFAQRRLVASVIMLFLGAALLCTQFLDTGWNNELWQVFVKFWPILLVLFGVDMIFSGHSLINAAVIITAALILVVVLLAVFDVPVVRNLPIDLSAISSVIPQGDLKEFFLEPVQSGADAMNDSLTAAKSIPQIMTDTNGALRVALPEQKRTSLDLRPVSGRISLKAGNTGQFMYGTVSLNPQEHLSSDASLKGNTVVYKLGSDGRRDNSGSSNWDLTISPKRKTDMNVVLNDGYLKADLRGMNLSAVSLENKSGPIDVMTMKKAGATIKIKAGNGDIRVYIPKNVRIACTIKGASAVDYPQNNYTFNNGSLEPRVPAESPVLLEITSNRGNVRIIESE